MDEFKKSEKLITVIILVVIFVLVLGIGVSYFKNKRLLKVDPNLYQVVFLDGNQQYFGHLSNINTDHPYLTDAYYLQTQNPKPDSKDQPLINLVKVGNEIYGPEDVLYFGKGKIVLWANLRADSKVIKGIIQEKAQRAQAATPSVDQTPPPQPATK